MYALFKSSISIGRIAYKAFLTARAPYFIKKKEDVMKKYVLSNDDGSSVCIKIYKNNNSHYGEREDIISG